MYSFYSSVQFCTEVLSCVQHWSNRDQAGNKQGGIQFWYGQTDRLCNQLSWASHNQLSSAVMGKQSSAVISKPHLHYLAASPNLEPRFCPARWGEPVTQLMFSLIWAGWLTPTVWAESMFLSHKIKTSQKIKYISGWLSWDLNFVAGGENVLTAVKLSWAQESRESGPNRKKFSFDHRRMDGQTERTQVQVLNCAFAAKKTPSQLDLWGPGYGCAKRVTIT